MPRRDPHLVLGVAPDASAATVKAAWRRLAREHHPDLTVGDPGAAEAATRRMAEINAAYEELRDRAAGRRGRSEANGARPSSGGPFGAPFGGPFQAPDGGRRGGGPPRARSSRPVTGRVDTSSTFRARNRPLGGEPSIGRVFWTASGPPPPQRGAEREEPRASDPTGPLRRGRVHRFRPPEPPSLADARDREVAFGKFRGHTLGQIADFEPSYVDWIASTITRDPELVAAARVVRADLDERGVTRARRPDRSNRAAEAESAN